MTAKAKIKRCAWCRQVIPMDVENKDWPYRLGQNMLFCSPLCMDEKQDEMNEKRSATMRKKVQNKKEGKAMGEDMLDELEAQETAKMAETVETVRMTAPAHDVESRELESMRIDREIDRKLIAELEAEREKLLRKNAALVRMLREAVELVE